MISLLASLLRTTTLAAVLAPAVQDPPAEAVPSPGIHYLDRFEVTEQPPSEATSWTQLSLDAGQPASQRWMAARTTIHLDQPPEPGLWILRIGGPGLRADRAPSVKRSPSARSCTVPCRRNRPRAGRRRR